MSRCVARGGGDSRTRAQGETADSVSVHLQMKEVYRILATCCGTPPQPNQEVRGILRRLLTLALGASVDAG